MSEALSTPAVAAADAEAPRRKLVSPRPPVTAAQPTSGGTAPAAPPMTMFCGVRRLSQMV